MSWSGAPVAEVGEEARTAYLRRVLTLTVIGLGISGVTSILSSAALALMPGLLTGWMPMLLILGCWAISNFVAQPMVFGGAKIPGFILGTAAQGVAMGFLLLAAMTVSGMALGNPFILIALAAGLTGFSALGMTAYVWIAPRNFSMIGAALSALSIPMLIVMAIGIAAPSIFGGPLGLVMSGAFVLISAGALLYQLNDVLHRFTTSMPVEGAYTITMGILVLFWNILSLLMRLNRR